MMQQLHTITFLWEIISDLREMEQIDDHAKVVVLSKNECHFCEFSDNDLHVFVIACLNNYENST